MHDTFLDDDVPEIPLLAEGAPPPKDASIDLVLLDATKVRLFRTGGSTARLTVTDAQLGAPRTFLRVQVARAFPLSDTDHFIGFRDDKDKDIGMLETLTSLDAASHAVVGEELERRYFIPKVLRVRTVREEYGTSTWEVETDRGDRTFYLQNLKDSVMELSATRIIVTDRDGSRWEFPDVRLLTGKPFTILQKVL